jgi:hypothetical protein
MRRFIANLAATVLLAGPANAFSILSQTEPSFDPVFWADIYAGYAGVTSDVTVGTPKSVVLQQNIPFAIFFSETIFSTSAGSIGNSTFHGPLDAAHSAGTSSSSITITNIPVGPRADSPPEQIIGIGNSLFSLTASYATLTPTLGSISLFEAGTVSGVGFGSFSLSQSGSNLDGSLILTDGSATRTIQFVASSDFDVVSLSPAVSAVPLPPALRMFASGLLALGLFGFVRRKKSVTQSAL